MLTGCVLWTGLPVALRPGLLNALVCPTGRVPLALTVAALLALAAAICAAVGPPLAPPLGPVLVPALGLPPAGLLRPVPLVPVGRLVPDVCGMILLQLVLSWENSNQCIILVLLNNVTRGRCGLCRNLALFCFQGSAE